MTGITESANALFLLRMIFDVFSTLRSALGSHVHGLRLIELLSCSGVALTLLEVEL